MKDKAHSKAGFTLIEIMIVIAIIGLLAGIAIPNYIRSRKKAQQVTCVANLQAIEGAIQNWALEEKKSAGQAVTLQDISAYLNRKAICPSGGSSFEDSYQISCVDARPACLRVPDGPFAHAMP